MMTLSSDALKVERPTFMPLAHCALGFTALIPFALLFSRAVADGLLSSVALLFLFHCFRSSSWQWTKQPLYAVLLLLWGYVAFAVPLGSARPWMVMAEGLVWGRFPVFFAAVTLWVIRQEKALKILLIALGAALGFAAIDTAVQFVQGVSLTGNQTQLQRLTGPLERPNIGMVFAKLAFPFALLSLVMLAGQRAKQSGIVLFFLFCLVLILVSGERSAALLSCMALIALGGVFFLQKPKWRIGVLLAGIVFTVLLCVTVQNYPYLQQRVTLLTTQLSHFGQTEYGQLWKASLMIWQDHPVFGIGIHEFRHMCPPLKEAGLVTYCDLHSHNTYLEWLVETGSIGFAGFLGFVTLMVAHVVKQLWRGGEKSAAALAMVASGIICLFPLAATQSFFTNWPAILAWYSISLSYAGMRSMQHE